MRKLFRAELWLGVLPFIATLGMIGFWDRVTPRVFGLPFNLFWVSLWAVLATVVLWILELRRKKR